MLTALQALQPHARLVITLDPTLTYVTVHYTNAFGWAQSGGVVARGAPLHDVERMACRCLDGALAIVTRRYG